MGVVRTTRTQEDRVYSEVYRDDGSWSETFSVYETRQTESVPFDEAQLAVMFDVTKANSDNGLVSGWANVALDKNGEAPIDWQDDIIEPETLEKAAIQFMLDYRESGEMHKGASQGVVVESIMLTKEKQQAIGIPEGTVPEGWFITVKVTNPEVFAKVKSGQYRMFSIQGTAKRVEQ